MTIVRHRLLERSLVLRLGAALGAVVLLAVIGMASSAIVADTLQGSGEAIDLAGSLRMQSQRIVTLVLLTEHGPPSLQMQDDAAAALRQFDATLRNSRLQNALPAGPETSLRIAYRNLTREWLEHLEPTLQARLQNARYAPPETDDAQLAAKVDRFIGGIDRFVKLLSQATDAKVRLQRIILGASLFLTVIVAFVSMFIIHGDVLVPLRDLLDSAERVGRGQFGARTQYTGADELGRLGQAFNGMAEELSKLYRDLENRVEEKTAALSRSNRSLELLYHSIARLYNGPVAPDTYAILLKDVENILGIERGSACLVEGASTHAHLLASNFGADGKELCRAGNCVECMGGGCIRTRPAPDGTKRRILSLPLSDAEHQHGVLQMELAADRKLEPWESQLLEALCRHIGTAVGMAVRREQGRRISLLEERAVIARELHDSLAQSLSFMKIQVSRLQTALGPKPSTEAARILAELRAGLNSAYRELRELLTTFRLKVGGISLGDALQETVNEFAGRGNIPILLEAAITGCRLSPNEEIHVLQVVREALSNVIHHANAQQARVTATFGPDSLFFVTVEDNGIGLTHAGPDTHHYGTTIMQERARSLGGRLAVENRARGGTRVALRFRPAVWSEVDTVQEKIAL